MAEIQNISIELVKVHPNNVRKTYNDIEELAESIKAKGILQNLTVVPDPQEPGKYLTVIGNRRLTAARMAGLETVPCIVSDMDEKEQTSVMLLENIQRSDLTVYEQAQGFQMMLDLGDTEDQIAEKTGFSKSTVRHRLNIAKLDQEKLKEKQQDDAFQLTLKDLYELEKIKDVEMRNEILDKASSSRDIVSRVQNEITNAKKKENAKKLKAKLKKMGVEKAPEQYSQQMYNGKWKTVIEINLTDDVPDEIELPEQKGQMYWYETWRDLRIVTKAPKEKKNWRRKSRIESQKR